jgi:hypothetical protein
MALQVSEDTAKTNYGGNGGHRCGTKDLTLLREIVQLGVLQHVSGRRQRAEPRFGSQQAAPSSPPD